jgi:DTW domain-containing protein YfiP
VRCHPVRSEGSHAQQRGMLRSAQHDMVRGRMYHARMFLSIKNKNARCEKCRLTHKFWLCYNAPTSSYLLRKEIWIQ